MPDTPPSLTDRQELSGSAPLLDGIDPRWPGHAAAESHGWLAEWRRGLAPEPEEKAEPIIVPHVYEGFEGRPLDAFTPYTDLERMRPAGPAPHENQRKGMDGKEREPSPGGAGVPPAYLEEEAGEDAGAPGANPEDDLEAELAYLRSIAPPVAINPAAPWSAAASPTSTAGTPHGSGQGERPPPSHTIPAGAQRSAGTQAPPGQPHPPPPPPAAKRALDTSRGSGFIALGTGRPPSLPADPRTRNRGADPP